MAEGVPISELPDMLFRAAVRADAVLPIAYNNANAKLSVGQINTTILDFISNALDGVAEAEDLRALEARVTNNEQEIERLWDSLACVTDLQTQIDVLDGKANAADNGAMRFRGAWSKGTQYKVGDVVSHNDNLYICIQPTNSESDLEIIVNRPIGASNRYFEYLSGLSESYRRKLLSAMPNGVFNTDAASSTDQYLDLDFNDDFYLKNTGIWWGQFPGNANAPVNDGTARWYGLINIRHRFGVGDGTRYGEQIAIGTQNAGLAGRMWTRSQTNRVWTGWVEKANKSDIPAGIVSGYTKLLADEGRSAAGWKPIAYVSYAEITSTTYDITFSLMWVPTTSHTFGVYHRPIPKFVGFVFDARIDGYLLQHDGRPTMTAIKDNVNSRWIIVVPAPGGYTVGHWLCNDPNNLVTPWAGAAIPDISGYTQSQYVSPFGGTPSQFVKGDGSLDSVSPVPIIEQSGIVVSGHPSFIIWKGVSDTGYNITLKPENYTEGNIIDVYVEGVGPVGHMNISSFIIAFPFNNVFHSKNFSQSCYPYIYRFIRSYFGLEFICRWAVDT